MLGVRVGCEAYLVVERSAQLDRTTALLMPDLLKFGHGRQADVVVVVVIKGFLQKDFFFTVPPASETQQ